MNTRPAGPELDRLVCEALGIPQRPVMAGFGLMEYPPVSTDPGAAWSVLVPALRAKGATDVFVGHQWTSSNEWHAATIYGGADVEQEADTMPLALCRAALAWCEAKKGETK